MLMYISSTKQSSSVIQDRGEPQLRNVLTTSQRSKYTTALQKLLFQGRKYSLVRLTSKIQPISFFYVASSAFNTNNQCKLCFQLKCKWNMRSCEDLFIFNGCITLCNRFCCRLGVRTFQQKQTLHIWNEVCSIKSCVTRRQLQRHPTWW